MLRAVPDTAESFRNRGFRWALLLVLAICSALFIKNTLQWPMVGDSSLIHYAVFMIQHHLAPYRDVIDYNLPGSYGIDWAVFKVFGSGSLAWRFFDFSLMAVAALSMVVIAWPNDWFAGMFAASLFMLVHGRDGIAQTGQRDLVMAVLLLASTALLFVATRVRKSWITLFAGIMAGSAVTIKPTALAFPIAVMVFSLVVAGKEKNRVLPYMSYGFAGVLIPVAAVVIFLQREHSLAAFFDIMSGLAPYHASMDRQSVGFLLSHSISPLLPLVIPWLILVTVSRLRPSYEHGCLLIAALCGLLSYVFQGKGYPYHRYPFLAFLLVIMGIEFVSALRSKGELRRILGGIALLIGVLVIAPVSVTMASRYDWQDLEFITTLQSDLDQLGGASLSNDVQCMDTTAGCINTLDRMHLVQSTGLLYDCYLFAARQTPVTQRVREQFWRTLTDHPPRVMVVSDQFCLGGTRTYDKLDGWPKFNQFVTDDYSLYVERRPERPVRWWSRLQMPFGYRIYVRK
jgi:hypothetical protein